MRTKLLGRTGLTVSIVGLGTVFVGRTQGGTLFGAIDEDLAVATIHAAVEAGCTLIDTAPLYNDSASEQVIGRALGERPDLAARCTVTTKVGRQSFGRDYSYDAIMHDVESSLRRLEMDRLDIVYIHDAMGVPMADVMGKDRALGALRRLQDEKVIGYVGTAANDPETNADYLETGEFDAAVVADAWSLLNQRAMQRILPAAERHNAGIVTATPLERGLLATGPQAGADYLNRAFSPACLNHVAEMQDLCRQHGVPLLAVALQWCTRHPQIAATIPGARNPMEIAENARAADVEIPADLWSALEPFIRDWARAELGMPEDPHAL